MFGFARLESAFLIQLRLAQAAVLSPLRWQMAMASSTEVEFRLAKKSAFRFPTVMV